MFAVAGGPILILPGCDFWGFLSDFGAPVLSFLGFGLGAAPPYFSSSSCVELYFVAAFSLSIVLVRSACCASSRWLTVSIRKV